MGGHKERVEEQQVKRRDRLWHMSTNHLVVGPQDSPQAQRSMLAVGRRKLGTLLTGAGEGMPGAGRVPCALHSGLVVAVQCLAHTLLHKLPQHKMWSTLLGFSSSLNFGGRSCARCGMCRSPMHNTRTMLLAGAAVVQLLLLLMALAGRRWPGTGVEDNSLLLDRDCMNHASWLVKLFDL